MALVAYDDSGSSDYEDVENVAVTTNNEKHQDEPKQSSSDILSSGGNLFNLLPQPSNKKPTVIEEDDEFLHKKEDTSNIVKPKAKITVPSLSDFKDLENSTSSKKTKPVSSKKSSLLSILPQPKNGVDLSSKSLIPYILTQKPNKLRKEPIPAKFLKKDKVPSKVLINDYSDESDDEGVENDFFSINKPAEIVSEATIESQQEASITNKPPFNIESYYKADNVQNDSTESMQYIEATSSHNSEEAESRSNEVLLDEEAIMKLCGTHGKRKREDIQILDIDQTEVLADAKQWLLKGLMDDTSKRVSVSRRKGNEPTNQQKRKHQITYLAYQAKANEADLQNQWANNRLSKRQTQSKYGF